MFQWLSKILGGGKEEQKDSSVVITPTHTPIVEDNPYLGLIRSVLSEVEEEKRAQEKRMKEAYAESFNKAAKLITALEVVRKEIPKFNFDVQRDCNTCAIRTNLLYDDSDYKYSKPHVRITIDRRGDIEATGFPSGAHITYGGCPK